jgi:hypothetical protein
LKSKNDNISFVLEEVKDESRFDPGDYSLDMVVGVAIAITIGRSIWAIVERFWLN